MKQGIGALIALCLMCGCEPPTVVDAGDPGLDGAVDAGPVTPCAADRDCDDGRFCNGLERCMPAADGAAANGCVPGMSPCAEGEICEEDHDRCSPDACSDGGDADGDGDRRPECGGGDCNDEDGSINSGVNERCDPDGVDEDCNPRTIYDEDANDGDRDGDGFVDTRCFNVRDDGTENRGLDCDDTRPTINTAGVEACDGLDNDCDGRIDEGVQNVFYFDFDNDNYGRSDMNVMACTRPDGYALVGGDCDDGEVPSPHASSVNPGATEVCNGRDDDCDGVTDPGCACVNGETLPCGMDVGACELGSQTCVDGEWGPCVGGVGPTTEVCGGGDEDCDGLTDESGAAGERTFYRDADGDGYGDPDDTRVACPGPGGAPPSGYVENNRDCADTRSDVHPGATYMAVPYCREGVRCLGIPACAESKSACLSGSFLPSTPSFDYDCNGSVEVQPPGVCNRSCFVMQPGPVKAVWTAADCGRDVDYLTRCSGLSCNMRMGAPQPLACR